MDCFNVPKKVNRHVLKALSALNGEHINDPIPLALIQMRVKHQMRNLVPVYNVDDVIKKSLQNLSLIGVIVSHGLDSYAIGHNYDYRSLMSFTMPGPPPNHHDPQKTNGPDRSLFQRERKQKSRSSLDPNLKRKARSSASLSGDEFDRTRKRMRTNNKKINYTGKKTVLPRARQVAANDVIIIDETESSNQIDIPKNSSCVILSDNLQDNKVKVDFPKIGISAMQLAEHLEKFPETETLPLYFEGSYVGSVELNNGEPRNLTRSESTIIIFKRKSVEATDVGQQNRFKSNSEASYTAAEAIKLKYSDGKYYLPYPSDDESRNSKRIDRNIPKMDRT